MVLPTEKTKPDINLYNYHWLIYGQPKIGKSSFAAMIEDALFIPTEPGLEALSVYKATPKENISSWGEFLNICRDIDDAVTKGTFKFKIVVIDTADLLLKYCSDHVCKKYNMQHPSDEGYGKGWSLLNDEFKRTLLHLSSLVKIMFISHATDKEISTRTMKITKTCPTLSGQAGQFIVDMPSIIGYVTTDVEDTDKRVIHFRGHESLVAGDRTQRLDPIMDFDFEAIKAKFSEPKKVKKKSENKGGEKV